MTISWPIKGSSLLLNPKWPVEKINNYQQLYKQRPQLDQDHYWLTTSGTTKKDSIKLVALSYDAILTSAHEVNQWLDSYKTDIWLNALPLFHIGGLSILARAHLSGAKVFSYEASWSAQNFVNVLVQHSITLTSLVPTQIFDLVQKELICPPSLRVVLVGGGRLQNNLYQKARQLGWPLLLTYGMTEMSSQVATSPLLSLKKNEAPPPLYLLPHVQARVDSESQLYLQSQSLFTGYLILQSSQAQWVDPKEHGEWKTEDFVELELGQLKILNRKIERVKVLGELVNLSALESQIMNLEISLQKGCLLALSDDRKEHDLVYVIDEPICQSHIRAIEKFNEGVAPFERVSGIYRVPKIPRTELGKIQKQKVIVPISPCGA